MTTRVLWFLVFLGLVGLGMGCQANLNGPNQIATSSFKHLQLHRSPGGEGLCLEAGRALSIELVQQEEGYLLKRQRLVALEQEPAPGVTCYSRDAQNRCLTHKVLEDTTVPASKVGPVLEALAALPKKGCEVDRDLVCDLCLSETITVDGNSEDPDCCGTLQNKDFPGAWGALVEALEALDREIGE